MRDQADRGAFSSRRGVALIAAMALLASVFAYLPAAAARPRRPDLIVTSVARPPGFKQPGESLSLKDTVKNAGNKLATRSTTRYFLSENATKGGTDIRLTGERGVGALKPGKKSTGSTQLTVPISTPSFLYYVLVCADARNQITEKNERNNCRASGGRMLVDGPQESNPLTVTSTLGTGAVTETFDKNAGGTLATTGADGTQYRLEIPANALIETIEITMTPIDSIVGSSHEFEFDGGLGGAVELEPHGLRLYQPATLAIEPTAPPAGDTTRLGFAYDEGGEEFHLHPWRVEGSTIKIGLTHFSGAGAGYASEIDLSSLPEFIPANNHPEFRNEHSLGELVAQLENGDIDPEEFADLASRIFIAHFYRHIVPALARALLPDAPESDAFDAFNQCTGWARQGALLDLMDHQHSELKIKMQTLWDFCVQQFPKIAKKQFDMAHERCSRRPPVNPPEQVRIMLRWARLSDLMLGGAHSVLGADYFDKVMECIENAPASVTGTVSYHWTQDSCYVPPPGCGTAHTEQSGTLQVSFNKRSPNFCCDWDDAGGNYEAQLLEDDAWVTDHSGEVCDNTFHAEASNSHPTGPGSDVSLQFTFSPAEDDHDAFLPFTDYVEGAQSNRHRRFNCEYPFDESYTTAAVFFSHDCPFREPGVPRNPGLMGSYNPGDKTIDMTCSDDKTVDGVQEHIEVTGTLTVTGNL